MGFQRTKALPVRSTFNGCIFYDRTFVLLTRRPYFDSPAFDMVGGTRVDLHVVPIIAGKVFYHSFSQGLGTPLALKVVAPHTGRNAIYLVAAQCSINTFLFIHDVLLLSSLLLYTSTFWMRTHEKQEKRVFAG